MNKLFKTSHGYLYPALKRNPKLVTPISHLHNAKTLDPDSRLGFVFNELEELESSKPTNQNAQLYSETKESSNLIGPNEGLEPTFPIAHPWPEWVDLMECLIKRGYFDGDGNPFNKKNEALGSKDANCIRTACLNFGRDQYSLIRYLSKKDIQMVVRCGCPSTDRKVANAGKRLRAHVAIDEGNVCSSCNLRGNCERAFVKPREDEGGRTVDVMRILLTYGLDPITGRVENKLCLNKLVKEAVRRLIKQMVEYITKEPDSDLLNSKPVKGRAAVQDHENSQEHSHINAPMKQGDWHCPKCNFLNFSRNIRCLRCDGLFLDRLKQLREDQDHIPLKKGDWICDKCNFLNFQKNTRCRKCKENPPKRQLTPGEWECESCNYINFRRNTECLRCGYKPIMRCDNLFLDRLEQLQEDQDHLPLKPGDWICNKCNFRNYAKNTICRQCNENPPKRQLNPGDWCNYINFKRTVGCLKCDHKRQKASNVSDTSAQPEHEHRGNFNHSRLKLITAKHGANNWESRGIARQSQKRGIEMWRSTENESKNDDDQLNPWSENSGYDDFPSSGDNGGLSRNPERGDKLKLKIQEINKSIATIEETDTDLLESTDEREPDKRTQIETRNLIKEKESQGFYYF